VLIPSLVLLYTLFLRGRLDTPESHATEESGGAPLAVATVPAGAAEYPAARADSEGAAASASAAPEGLRGARAADEGARRAAGRWGAAAAVGLVTGAGLLVLTDAPWTHVLGVAGLLLCAVAVFRLTATPLDR
jgi:hypothetical protein